MKKYFLPLMALLFSLTVIGQYDLEPLEVGMNAPNFKGLDQYETALELSELLEENEQVVLIFYRGAWCPYCKKHASQVQDSLRMILDKGASVVMVTPEKSASIEKMVSKTKATFSIVHDVDYQIMTDYGVAFHLNKETVPSYFKFVVNATRKANENKEDILPVPATYIIDKDGKISFVQYDRDYKVRTSVAEILENL